MGLSYSVLCLLNSDNTSENVIGVTELLNLEESVDELTLLLEDIVFKIETERPTNILNSRL